MRERSRMWMAAMMTAVALATMSTTGVSVKAWQPQEEFVPIDQLPPDDQLPAAPLLVTAYGIVWIVVFVYLWSIRRRQDKIERELADFSKRVAGGGNPQ